MPATDCGGGGVLVDNTGTETMSKSRSQKSGLKKPKSVVIPVMKQKKTVKRAQTTKDLLKKKY